MRTSATSICEGVRWRLVITQYRLASDGTREMTQRTCFAYSTSDTWLFKYLQE